MTTFDRYILRELIRPFGFFMLVFTGVIWLTQSLRVIDTVVNSGKGAAIFLEFSALLLPFVLTIVLPIAAFGATLFAINRLFAESEIVVALAGGLAPVRLARPVALFGAGAMLVTAASTVLLTPLAAREMRDRVAELRSDIAGALIFEGRFLHPADGLTVFVEDNVEGALKGVFVSDRREPERPVIYTARRALLNETAGGPQLVMFDGAAQQEEAPGRLSVLRFDRLAFDLGQFMRAASDRVVKPSERTALELVAPNAKMLARDSLGRLYAEGHEQLSSPLYALALPLLGLALILRGGYSRQGYGVRILIAASAGVGLRLAGLGAKALTTGVATAWPLLYAPPLIGLAAALWLLGRGGRTGRNRGRAA